MLLWKGEMAGVEELVMGEEEVEEETRLLGQLKKWCRG